MSDVGIQEVKQILDRQKQSFLSDRVKSDDYLEPPSWPYYMYPSEKIERLKEIGVFEEYMYNSNAEREALEYVKSGNLVGANNKFLSVVRKGTKLTKDHLWPWCIVLALAKNFDDLKYLVEYLYAYNACYNRLCKRNGYTEVLQAYQAYGTQPPMGYSCDAGDYLRNNLCNDALGSKSEIEQRFSRFGGGSWSNYKLTDAEFESFKRNFGMPMSATKPSPRPAPSAGQASSSSSSSSGGCYVATCVYGSYDCPEVWTLRRYRDITLANNVLGRSFIKAYYAISPHAVKAFGAKKSFKTINKRILDGMVKRLQNRGFESTPYEDGPGLNASK